MNCTFFGHHDAPSSIKPKLYQTIVDLILDERVNMFYVGNQGNFDRMVIACLKKAKEVYAEIDYVVVLAYMPTEKRTAWNDCGEQTIYPDGLETVPRRFAISRRNTWMLGRADVVVTYVKSSVGGAARFKLLAEKKRKTVINLAEIK